jgi:hypothetical protein
MSPAVCLVEGSLYALCNPYAVDGRVTWHDPQARGFAPMNTYVLREDGHALLIDTGVSIHTEALVDELAELVGERSELAVLHTRIGEYTTICNTIPIDERFAIATVYSEQDDSPRWVDFRPGYGRDAGAPQPLAGARIKLFSVPDTLAVDPAATRVLDIFHATLRLLPTSWVYDRRTRTLFTSDVFTHLVPDSIDGPWVLTAETDPSTIEMVRSHLLSTRYWWLAGARLDTIRQSIAETFARHDVETLAPDFGCILHGRELVARHVEMLDAVLAQAARMEPPPVLAAGAQR